MFNVTDLTCLFARTFNFDIISITNILSDWPASWGGFTRIVGRNENTTIQVLDIVFENDVVLSPLLYEIVGEEVNGEIVPIFKFRLQN